MLNNEILLKKIEENNKNLSRLCMKLCGDYHDAQDLYQETILQVVTYKHTYKEDKPFDKWVYSICVNCFKKLYKKARQLSMTEFKTTEEKDVFIENQTAAWGEDYTDKAFVRHALSLLKPKKRIAVVLFYFEDYKITEIAEITGVPEGTVKNHLHSARNDLKNIWERSFEDEKQ